VVNDCSFTLPFMYRVTNGCVDQSLRLMIKTADSTSKTLNVERPTSHFLT